MEASVPSLEDQDIPSNIEEASPSKEDVQTIERKTLKRNAEIQEERRSKRKKKQAEKKLRLENEENEMQRKQEKVKALGIQNIDAVLRYFLLGDYLTSGIHTICTDQDIEQRFSCLDRVKKILQECKNAHPDAVFQFCVDHPNGGSNEFQTLKENVQEVFKKEFSRIFRLAQVENPDTFSQVFTPAFTFLNTPLEKEYKAYITQYSDFMVRSFQIFTSENDCEAMSK